MMELEIQTMQPGERLYAYRQSTQLEGQTGGVGYLRGDFGKDGREFFTTWEDGHGRYKTDAFRQEFDRVVDVYKRQVQSTLLIRFCFDITATPLRQRRL